MNDKIKKALKQTTCGYAEVRLEEVTRTAVTYLGKELEAIGTADDIGGNVRAYHRGGWGFVSFNDPKDLTAYVREACRQAKMVGGTNGAPLAPVDPVKDAVRVQLEDDPRKVDLAEKEKLMRRYNDLILEHPKIQTSATRYEDVYMRRTFANTQGAFILEERIYCGTAYSATAKEGANVQFSFGRAGGTRGWNTVLGQEAEVEKITKEAVDLLKAEKPEAGTYTVIADSSLGGVFAHEAFGHLSEADFIYENERFKEIMTLSKRFGADALSIVDDGSIPGERGSFKYDDEGVKTRKNYLIKDGILVGRLHNRETAGKMGERVTGNARAISFRHTPIVRMTNTYIEPRDWSFERLLQDTDHGIYAIDALGGTTELEMFTFSAAKAYLIRDGKLGPMLRDVILSGNVFETMKAIDAIGNDFRLHGGLGGCGKGGQAPLPVSDGGPHIRIRNVVIGGK
jgi:predicted Zn-dependent protease